MSSTRALASLVLLSASLGVPSFAQDDAPDTSQIQNLIRALEGQLRELETSQNSDGRVTEIGGSRVAREEDEERLSVRIYDISDLFSVAPPYVARHQSDLSPNIRSIFPSVSIDSRSTGGGMMGGMGGGMFSVASRVAEIPVGAVANLKQDAFGDDSGGNLRAAQSSVDDLINAIQSTITPDQWEDVGGPGSIARLGNALLISAGNSAHDQIKTLLDLFRKRWGSLQTVSISAQWLWATNAQMEQLLVPPEVNEYNASGVVSAVALEREYDDENPSGVAYQANLTCYNGQTVSAVSGQQSTAITGMVPVVGDSEPAYQPIVSVIQQGVALQVTPLITSGGKYVILDVHSRVSRLDAESPRGSEVAPAIPVGGTAVVDVVKQIDRPKLSVQSLSTTMRMPLDQPMLVGGMTFPNEDAPKTLYLVVTASTQELRDDDAQVVAGTTAVP